MDGWIGGEDTLYGKEVDCDDDDDDLQLVTSFMHII